MKKMLFEADFNTQSEIDSSNLEKELISIMAFNLALKKQVMTGKFDGDEMLLSPRNDYLNALPDEDAYTHVNEAKKLIEQIDKGITINTKLYSTFIKRETQQSNYTYKIIIKPDAKTMISEAEARGQSVLIRESLQPYSNSRIIKDTLNEDLDNL